MDADLRRANALIAATRRLHAGIGALLASPSLAELDRTIVDVLPGAVGFERVALLSPPGGHEPAHLRYSLGYPPLDLKQMAKTSPLASTGFLDGARTGYEDDDDLPHGDVRGAYVLAPLRDRAHVVGLLYADSLREDVDLSDAASSVAYALEIAGVVRANLSLTAELISLARTDALTGLANRRVFDERLEEELHRSARSRHAFALAIFDVDHFKQINDRHGHSMGDQALRSFAQVIRTQARSVDFLARFAGDEFAMILIDVDHAAAQNILARTLDAIRKAPVSHGAPLSASAGATLSCPADSTETIIERADAALYSAKQRGRDQAAFG